MGGASSRRVFVCELLGGSEAAASGALLPQGVVMRDAIATDLLRSADCELSVVTCAVDLPRPAGAVVVRGEDAQHFVARQEPGLHSFIGVDLVLHAMKGPVMIQDNPHLACVHVGMSPRLSRNLALQVLQEYGLG